MRYTGTTRLPGPVGAREGQHEVKYTKELQKMKYFSSMTLSQNPPGRTRDPDGEVVRVHGLGRRDGELSVRGDGDEADARTAHQHLRRDCQGREQV